MSAQLLDGKATASVIRRELADRPAEVTAAGGPPPGLGTVLVGDDPGSRAYVAGKHRDRGQVGIASIRRELPADAAKGPGRAGSGSAAPRRSAGNCATSHDGAAAARPAVAAHPAERWAPMPGGVGPMTRAMLLANVVEAAERNANAV